MCPQQSLVHQAVGKDEVKGTGGWPGSLRVFLLLLISLAPSVSKAQHDRLLIWPRRAFLFVRSIIMLERAHLASGEGMDKMEETTILWSYKYIPFNNLQAGYMRYHLNAWLSSPKVVFQFVPENDFLNLSIISPQIRNPPKSVNSLAFSSCGNWFNETKLVICNIIKVDFLDSSSSLETCTVILWAPWLLA